MEDQLAEIDQVIALLTQARQELVERQKLSWKVAPDLYWTLFAVGTLIARRVWELGLITDEELRQRTFR